MKNSNFPPLEKNYIKLEAKIDRAEKKQRWEKEN